jgi:hypothetical protein
MAALGCYRGYTAMERRDVGAGKPGEAARLQSNGDDGTSVPEGSAAPFASPFAHR